MLVALAARRLGRSPQAAVALVGLNPLVLVYGIGGAHNEPLVLLSASPRSRWRSSAGGREGSVVGRRRGRLRGPRGRLQAVGRPARAVVVLACRRRLPALGGAGGAGALLLGVVGLVYGGHLPATGIQDGLVGPLSVPNVLAALAGHGG